MTCCYWMVNNHNGAKKSCSVLVLLQNICFAISMLDKYVLCITVRSIRYLFTMRGCEGQDGNGSARGKLSLVPSCRQRQNNRLI